MASKKTAFKAASQSTQKKKKRTSEQAQQQSQESRASSASSSENRATQETRTGGGRDIRVQNALEDRRTVTMPKRSVSTQSSRTRKPSASETSSTKANDSREQKRKTLTQEKKEALYGSKQSAKARRENPFARNDDDFDATQMYILPIGLGNDSIESFLFDSQDYVNGANSRLSSIRPGVDSHTATYNGLVSSAESLSGRAANIRAHLNTNRDQYSDEYYEEMMSYLDSFDEYASGISRQAKNYEDLVNRGLSQNQFNAELRDRYYAWQFRGNISNPDQSEIERLRNYANTAWEQGDDQAAREYEDQINWLSENTTGGRMWRYEQNNARIEEITRQLEEIERTYRPDETGIVNASREEMKSELISEKKNLETWNRQYERGEERGTDITNFTRNAPDFYEYSHADSYGDPNLDEIEADRAQVYGIADQEGNVYIDDGSFTNMTPVLDGGPSPLPTTLRDFKDPLGAYLSWSDEQKSQYVQQPNTSYGAVADAGTSGNWDFVNDNELAVYYYYLNKGNLTAAQAYLRSLDGTLLDRAKNQLAEDIQNASAGELFIRNVISVPQQVVGGVAAFGGAIGNALRGEGFRSGNAGMWQFAAGQTRAETAGRIDEATGNKSLLGISLGDAYQASMSALDSIFGGTFAGKAYTVFMGMGAAAQKAEEAYLSGASDQEIVSTALIAGALEYLSEKISWDKLVGTPTPATAKKAVINALEQAGFEGTEEVISSVGNNIADLLIMGDRSAFETTKRQLLAENPNMTDSDANFEALKMSLGDLWKDFVGGAISGLGMGGAESFFGAFSGEGYKQYRDAYKQAGLSLENSGATDAVLDTARVTSQEQTNAADKQNARDVSRAQKELSESASRAQALTEHARAARNTAQSSGSAESDTRPFASAVRDYYNQIHAKNLSNRAAVAVGRTVQLTSDTMDALNRVDKDNTEDRDVRFFQGLRGISPAQAAQNAVSDESKRQGMEYVTDESKRALAVSDDGRAHDARGNAITIDGVADVQDGKLMLATTDGEILPADIISYATPEEALVYETIQRMNVSKASAIALSEAYKAGEVSAQEFALGVNQAYNFGRIGVDMDKAISRSESFAANLTQQQRITAYRMGQIDAQTSFDAQQSAIDTRVANAAKSADVKIGKVIYEFDNSGFRMNEQQRQGVQIAKMVSALTGADVHLFESYERDGKRYYKDTSGNEAVAPNGFYSNGSVWVDVNAGNNGQGIVGVTLAHEFTHFIQEWSPEKFKVLGDYVIRRFNESNVNVDALVRAQMEKAKRARGEVLSYDDAYAEVVADSMEQMFTGEKSQALEQLAELKKQDATLWGKIKEWFKRIAKRLTAIRKAYSDVDADNETAAVVRGIDNFVEKASKIFAEGLDEAGKNYMAAAGEQSLQTQTIYEGRDIDGDPGTHLMSDRSMVEAAGLYFDYNAEDGTFRVLDHEGGTEVKSVTAEDIKASPLGAMINYAVKTPSNPSGTISAADARKQYQFFSDLINMCIEKNDVAMVWETTGSLVFSAIKNNADPQYTKTIDFSTICKKTKQLINVMSETMKAKGRGLTRSEVEIAYLQTGLAGEATPCPVCYVFARWIGVGGILDQISEFQKRYGAMDESQLRGFMEDMDARIAEYYEGLSKSKKEDLTGKNGQMKAGGVLSDMKSKATNAVNAATRKLADNAMYVADVEALDTLISQLDPNADAKQISDAKKERRKTAAKIVDNDALIRAYDDAVDVVNEYEAYQYLSRVMMQQTEDGTWVKREGFEPVPNDILFDLNRGDDFARNYPLAWGFRTGKGAAAGKAILPYSDARLGEIVQGIGYADIRNIGVGEENMFLNGDTQAAQKRIDAARAKARAQNLLGGTRFQSTSDFRFEFGSDYLLSFLEMQAIGSKVQLYTKVIEAVDFFATMGADVNLSVMPLNDGYITMEDGTKKLVYSPVTGVNGEAAIKKAKEYDNVQLILVGISDEHIRLALSSEDVTFVIPFHGSGNSTEQIQRLMELVRENLDLTQARDYTAVQSDHVMENRSAAQKAAWDLRVKILTGGAENLSNAEQAVLDSNPFLSDLYDRFYVDESAEEYGVKLGSAQAAIVFPFEYWDKSLDYAHADENGERFKEYCRTLGLIPRFSGINSSGENVGFGDFSNDPGYWKLLIDRKMYNNVYDADGNWTGYGTYHVQQPIDVSNFDVSLIDPKDRNALYSDVMSKDAKPEKTSIIAQAVIDNITADSYAQAAREEAVKNAIEKKQNHTKHSTRDDSEYMTLAESAESGDLDAKNELQDMVFEKAYSLGYTYRRNTRNMYNPQNNAAPYYMFVDTFGRTQDPLGDTYGPYRFVATDKNAIDVSDIADEIQTLARDYFGHELSDDELSPPDIVDSAGMWDNMDFVQEVWDNILERIYDETGEIPAVKTADGLLVFGADGKRIKSADPVVRDENGEIVPLSKRFDESSENILYSTRDYGEVKDEFDGEGDVEQTHDLIAVHNLTADELMKTLELEGFPMPSIAVIRANAGHSRYGDISVIFDKATIDPAQSRRNKIYGGDAWTPTFPDIEYEASSKLVDQIRDKYYAIPQDVRNNAARPLYLLYTDAERLLAKYGGEKGLIEHYADDTDMMQAYLADTGKSPVATVQKQTVTRLDADDIKLYDYLSDKLGKDTFSNLRPKNGESPATARKAWFAEYGDAFKSAYAQYLTQMGLSETDAQSVINDQPMSFFTSTAIKVRHYLANGAEKITTEPDYEATEAAIRKAVDPKAYESWLHGLLDGIEKRRGVRNNKPLFTDAGNRRSFKSLHYEVSLENIVRAMRGENEKGGAMFAATGLFGIATKDYGSIDQVRADKGRLAQLDEDAYTQMKHEYQNRFSDIAMTIMDKSDRNSFIETEDATNALLEAVRRGKTQAGMRRVLSEYKHLNIQPYTAKQLYDLVQEIAQMPTEYFEAKPRRAVGLEEIAYVVLPDNADAQLKTALDERNIPTLEYKAGDEADRARVLNGEETKSVRFSLRDTSSVDIATVEKENAQLREANEELRKQFQRTAGVQLDQKAIRKMARELLKQYDSSYDVDTLTDNLSKVFDVVANGGLTWDEASSAVVDMCRKVLEESSSFDAELYDYDQPVRDYLKNVRLEISDDMRGGIELVADNGAAYRRGLFGIVGTAKKGSGVSIDQMWREASEMFPAYFSEDIVNPEDQAERLYYLAQSLKRPNYFTNVYEQNIDAAAYDMMLQIGAKYLDVPQSKTFADKFAEKLEAARKASRDAIRKKAAELRAQQKTANRTEKRLDAKITQMAKVMAQIEARANRYQEQLATERETAKQRIRDIRTENAQEKRKLAEEYRQKNKEKLAELRENYNRNKLTRQIFDSLSSIRKLFENGRGTANVKQGMRDTVQATLGAAEVLFGEDDTISAHDVIMSSTLPASAAERALIDQYRNAAKSLVNATYLADNGIDVNANRRLAGKARRLMASLSQQLSSYVERAKQARTGVAVDTVIQNVADAYEQLKDSNDGYISAAYDANIAQYLANLKYVLNGKTIANMNNDELKSLRNAFRGVLWTIREQNAAFVSERRETVEQRSTDTMDEVTAANPDRQTKNTTLAGIRKALGWDNLKPFYAFERMQSPTLMRLFQNVRAGEDVWAVDVNEARDYFQNLARQYGYFDIDRSKRFTFTDKSGKAFELSIPQMMSLYAYSKRAAAMQHLENGGFVFDDTARLTDQKGKTKKNVAYNIKQAHVIDQSIVQDVVSELQKQNAGYLTFVDQMQSYLSKAMGAKGNEVSMKLYGVEMFGEAFYFPIITPGDNGSKPIVVNDTFKIKNSGFTQALNPNAVGTIVLSDFMDVWAKHINDMAMYHAFTLPLEDMNRVMNYRVRNENGVVTDSVRMRLTNAFTSDAVNYINQFITDINNGIRSDNRETFVKRMLSDFKKAKVFVNASVVIQQYSSIVRALDVIDAKYFVGVDKQSIGKKWNEVKRFAPIAAVKEMGHFDTGISGSTEEYIQKRSYQGIGENVKAFFTDRAQTEAALSFAPEFADKIAWTQIWSACKRKAADLNPNLSGDALLQKAGEYFTDVIVRTQVYDSTLSKSGLMRSKSAFLNMATAFMAEPTTTLNMLQHSLSDAKMGKPRAALRTVGSVFGSVMLNALLASIVFAARDDDEDKTYLEKYFAAVTSDFLDGINPLTMAPIVKDAWSLLQGYDVERSDMTLMSDTTSRIKSLVQVLSNLDPKAEGKELEEQNRELRNQVISAATAVANLFGIPFDNIVRDIRALFNTFGNAVPIKDTNGEMIRDSVLSALQKQIPVWNWLKDAESTSDKLYDAIQDGNAEYFARLTRGYEKDSQTNSAIQRALKENEDRITEAAKARMEGRINDYKALVRQMVSEYGLAHAGETTVQDNIIKAINAVIRELENKPSDDSYKPTKQLKMDDYVTAMANGREKDANTARETIIQEMVDYDGKTQDKAEESFVSSAVSAARSRYEDGEISEQTALRIIMDAKDCSKSDAQYTMTMWELQRKNPDVSNGRIEKWYNDVKSSGISLAVYNDYAVRMAECKGVDSDGDGKADPNTAKDQKLAVIDSLPISNEQKDFLYRLNNWAESKLYQAPWH